MRRVVQTVTGVGASPVIPLDYRAQVFNVGLAAVVTGTATYTVNYTLDDIYNPAITPTWFPVSNMTAATGNESSDLVTPASAVQLVITSGAGSVTLTALQSSGQG